MTTMLSEFRPPPTTLFFGGCHPRRQREGGGDASTTRMLRYSLTETPPVRPRRLRFGLLSAKEIERLSVVQVTETTLYYRGLPASGGLLDPLMGSVDRRHLCASCMRDAKTCQGHPGHIVLAYPVYHIGFVDTLLKTLRTVCFGCSRVSFSDEERVAAATLPKNARLQHAHTVLRGRRTCPHCDMPRPCYTRGPFGICLDWGDSSFESDEEEVFCRRPFTAREALSILTCIPSEDVELLGFDEQWSHPSCMIVQNVLVPPPCTRPAIYSSEGSRSRGQNDLTIRLLDILKRNHEVKGVLDGPWEDVEVSDALMERIHRLQYEVFVMVSNSSRIQRPPGMGRVSGGQTSKSLTDRLRGKEGRVRGNLMGKRVDFSARCVITPDAYFDCDRVGVPYKIAKELTIPEPVNALNLQSLSERVRKGAGTVEGAQNVICADGTVINLRSCQDRGEIMLKTGDVVERFLADDDVVVFNRQPSLHLHGMQAHRVTLMPGHTFRISLPVASPYNADFDGDEMNLHVPQSKVAAAECACLMSVSQNCIGGQANKPVMGIVQDTLVGDHIMTQNGILLDHPHACRLLGAARSCERSLPPPCVVAWVDGRARRLWTGKQIFSLLLPSNLYMDLGALPPPGGDASLWTDDELPVHIRGGKMLCGVLRKAHVGTAAGGIVDVLCREYGGVAMLRFMADNQRIVHQFLMQRGHHVGIDDVMLSAKGHQRVNDRLQKASRLCEEIQRELVGAPLETRQVGEAAILGMLGKMLLQTGGVVEEEMSKTNAIRRMVKGGSKGSFINLSQICACLGQQSLEGSRIVAEKGSRTLPCFAADDLSLVSRGMVCNSFSLGLSPTELFYHAIGGREGLVDTAVKTSQTGYLQRRMNKSMEDNTAHCDGTIRNAVRSIVSFRWGDNGLHPARVERVRLAILREDMASVARRFLPDELELVRAHRAAVLRVKTSILNCDFDERVLLPFNIIRMRKEMRRDVEAGGHRGPGEAQRPSLRPLLDATSSLVVRLAIVDLFSHRETRHLPPERLRAYMTRVHRLIDEAHVVGGESVGCLAAQSVGEPSTQMTLNTFHTAGVAAKNVTLGLPRLKEILDGSKNPKTPCTTLRFQAVYARTPMFAEYVASTIPLTRLGDVVDRCTVRHSPVDAAVEAGHLAETVWLAPGDDLQRHSSFVVSYHLHRDITSSRRLTPPIIRRILQERLQERAHVTSSEVNSIEWVLRVRFSHVRDMVEHAGLSADHEAMLCHRAMNVLLDTVVVGGHSGVTSADCVEQQTLAVSAAGDVVERKEHVVNVYGNFLVDCAAIQHVDWNRCTSNDLWEVYHTLGIEACVHVLYDQLKAVVSFDGTYVADHHLTMIADTICRGGTIMPLNRHGINRSDTSPLMRCSFEETADVLCNAGLHAEEENAKGVTSSIMMGQLAGFGTGRVQVLFPCDHVSRVLDAQGTGRVLRSTCRSHRAPTESGETMEYVLDDIKSTRVRSLSPKTGHARARFRHVSPSRDGRGPRP